MARVIDCVFRRLLGADVRCATFGPKASPPEHFADALVAVHYRELRSNGYQHCDRQPGRIKTTGVAKRASAAKLTQASREAPRRPTMWR